MAVAPDLSEHRFAAVDAHTKLRPIGTLRCEQRELFLERQRGSCGAEGVVGLVEAPPPCVPAATATAVAARIATAAAAVETASRRCGCRA